MLLLKVAKPGLSSDECVGCQRWMACLLGAAAVARNTAGSHASTLQIAIPPFRERWEVNLRVIIFAHHKHQSSGSWAHACVGSDLPPALLCVRAFDHSYLGLHRGGQAFLCLSGSDLILNVQSECV